MATKKIRSEKKQRKMKRKKSLFLKKNIRKGLKC